MWKAFELKRTNLKFHFLTTLCFRFKFRWFSVSSIENSLKIYSKNLLFQNDIFSKYSKGNISLFWENNFRKKVFFWQKKGFLIDDLMRSSFYVFNTDSLLSTADRKLFDLKVLFIVNRDWIIESRFFADVFSF